MKYFEEIKKASVTTLALSLVLLTIYLGFEPQLAVALSAADTVVITMTVDAGITITSPADVNMSRNLGVTASTAVASTTWNVKTNNNLGYALTLAASTNPALKSGTDYVDDYSTTTMPSLWSVTSGTSKFGFSVLGTDVNTSTWGTDAGNDCINGAHTPSATAKYYGFYTTATTTATRAATTTPSGVDTIVCYAVEQNGTYIPSGVYTATITATAIAL
jgi:hypothetical protein